MTLLQLQAKVNELINEKLSLGEAEVIDGENTGYALTSIAYEVEHDAICLNFEEER